VTHEVRTSPPPRLSLLHPMPAVGSQNRVWYLLRFVTTVPQGTVLGGCRASMAVAFGPRAFTPFFYRSLLLQDCPHDSTRGHASSDTHLPAGHQPRAHPAPISGGTLPDRRSLVLITRGLETVLGPVLLSSRPIFLGWIWSCLRAWRRFQNSKFRMIGSEICVLPPPLGITIIRAVCGIIPEPMPSTRYVSSLVSYGEALGGERGPAMHTLAESRGGRWSGAERCKDALDCSPDCYARQRPGLSPLMCVVSSGQIQLFRCSFAFSCQQCARVLCVPLRGWASSPSAQRKHRQHN
jgi:hypothetical protein